MKFFRKTSVAVLLTLLVIALCCVIGYTRAAPNTPQDISDAPAQQAGESGLNYYLSWIDDDAGLFSMDTTDTLARSNLSLHSNYGCLMAIQTINYLNGQDIETYAKNRFEETELGSMDMLLVIETSNQAWYLVYGGTLRPYVEESGVTPTLSSVVSNNLNASFFQGESDQGILRLFDGLETWCAAALPVLDHTSSGFSFFSGDSREQSVSLGDVLQGVLFTLLVNIWWIILVWVVLNVVDRVRFRRYITQYPPGTQTLIPFRPILFWHRQGSSWYRRMWWSSPQRTRMTTGISPAAPPRERATPSTRTSGTARAPTRAAPIPAPARTWGPTPPTSRGTSPKPATSGERGAPAAAPAGACSTPSSIRSAACSAAGGCEAASPLHLKNTGLGLCGLPQPKACLSLWICRYSALSPSAGAGDSAGWGGSSPFTATHRWMGVPMAWNLAS